MKEVRTRYAPSPTGYMHIGNLRTALFEYLIARTNNGKFILRVEDTDQKRYVEGAIEVIYSTMKTIGLKHDEGPDIGGPYAPYIQSERKSIYLPYAKELVKKKKAYYCFCSQKRLEELKASCEANGEQYKYDRFCLNLSESEIDEKLKSNQPFVIRQKMPDTGVTSYNDCVYGEIKIENTELEDQILIKSDGFPTYNFANVVDDHDMAITHVVRGSEYITSTPKYVLLYEAFGWDIPVYVHLPVVVKEGGKKISKRTGDATVEDLLEQGYLVEALINYIVLLGWSPGDEREFFTLKDLEKEFKISGISKSPSTLDYNKLKWMNGEYIRKLSDEEFLKQSTPWLSIVLDENKYDFGKICKVLQKRVEVLSDIPDLVDFINEVKNIDPELYTNKKMKCDGETAKIILPQVIDQLLGITDWNHDSLYAIMVKIAENNSMKNGAVMWPVRIALTGKEVTPGGSTEIADILGKEETILRLRNAIKKLEM